MVGVIRGWVGQFGQFGQVVGVVGVVGLSGQSEYQDLFRVHWRMIQIVNLKQQHTPELVIRIEFYNGQNSCKAGTLASIHGIANVSINCKTWPYEI